MILSRTLPDATAASGKSATTNAGQNRSGSAQAQFDSILSNLADSTAASSADVSGKQDTGKQPAAKAGSQQTTAVPVFSASGFAAKASTPGAGSTTAPSIPDAASLAAATVTAPASTAASAGVNAPAVSGAATTASLAEFLAALPGASTTASDAPDSTTGGLKSATTGRRRSDAASDSAAADAMTSASTVSMATPTLLSGLLGLSPMTQSQVSTTPGTAASTADALAKPPSGATLPGGNTTQALPGGATASSAAMPTLDASAAETAATFAASAGSTETSASKADVASALPSIVKSVTVETQLTPGPMLSPMQQVIDTVQKLATSDKGSGAMTTVTTTVVPTLSNRTMTLVLEPDNLGTVTVRMQLRGGSLDLQLDVANSQTLGLLTKDKDSLTAAMSGQDYSVGTLTLRASDTQTASQGSDNGSQNQDQRSGSSASAQGGSTPQDGGNASGGNGGSASSGDTRGDRGARQNAPRPSDDAALRDARSLSPGGTSGTYI